MLIVLFVILGLSLLIIGHEAGHFFAAKYFGLRVDEFGFGFPPRIFAWKKGETEYSLNWLPFGGFVRIAGENAEVEADEIAKMSEVDKARLFYNQAAWKRLVIIIAGIFVNFLLGWLLISSVLMVGSPQALVVGGVQPNTPAAQVGIMAGDVIKDYKTADAFIGFVNAHKGQEVVLHLMRGGNDISMRVTPRVNVPPGEGAIGVELAEAGQEREGFFRALYDGLMRSFLISWLILVTFFGLLKNLFFHATLIEGVVGPVGIFSVAEQTSKIGFVYFINLLSQISLSLAVFNVMPFRPLDGGVFFQILVEKITGSALSKKTIGVMSMVGFGFLMVLFVLITARDIVRLF